MKLGKMIKHPFKSATKVACRTVKHGCSTFVEKPVKLLGKGVKSLSRSTMGGDGLVSRWW